MLCLSSNRLTLHAYMLSSDGSIKLGLFHPRSVCFQTWGPGGLSASILQYLNSQRRACKTIDIARAVGAKTAKAVNPTLYQLQKQNLVIKVVSQPPAWMVHAGANSGVQSQNQLQDFSDSNGAPQEVGNNPDSSSGTDFLGQSSERFGEAADATSALTVPAAEQDSVAQELNVGLGNDALLELDASVSATAVSVDVPSADIPMPGLECIDDINQSIQEEIQLGHQQQQQQQQQLDERAASEPGADIEKRFREITVTSSGPLTESGGPSETGLSWTQLHGEAVVQVSALISHREVPVEEPTSVKPAVPLHPTAGVEHHHPEQVDPSLTIASSSLKTAVDNLKMEVAVWDTEAVETETEKVQTVREPSSEAEGIAHSSKSQAEDALVGRELSASSESAEPASQTSQEQTPAQVTETRPFQGISSVQTGSTVRQETVSLAKEKTSTSQGAEVLGCSDSLSQGSSTFAEETATVLQESDSFFEAKQGPSAYLSGEPNFSMRTDFVEETMGDSSGIMPSVTPPQAPSAAAGSHLKDKVLLFLSKQPRETALANDIAKALGFSGKKSINANLYGMLKNGLITKVNESPPRWRLTTSGQMMMPRTGGTIIPPSPHLLLQQHGQSPGATRPKSHSVNVPGHSFSLGVQHRSAQDIPAPTDLQVKRPRTAEPGENPTSAAKKCTIAPFPHQMLGSAACTQTQKGSMSLSPFPNQPISSQSLGWVPHQQPLPTSSQSASRDTSLQNPTPAAWVPQRTNVPTRYLQACIREWPTSAALHIFQTSANSSRTPPVWWGSLPPTATQPLVLHQEETFQDHIPKLLPVL